MFSFEFCKISKNTCFTEHSGHLWTPSGVLIVLTSLSFILISQFLIFFIILDDHFQSIIKQVHNSLTVHDNSWTLKFDNFSEFQNFISDSPQHRSSFSPSPRASLWPTVYEKRYVTHPLFVFFICLFSTANIMLLLFNVDPRKTI